MLHLGNVRGSTEIQHKTDPLMPATIESARMERHRQQGEFLNSVFNGTPQIVIGRT